MGTIYELTDKDLKGVPTSFPSAYVYFGELGQTRDLPDGNQCAIIGDECIPIAEDYTDDELIRMDLDEKFRDDYVILDYDENADWFDLKILRCD